MGNKFTNNAVSALSAQASASTVTLTLTAGEGAKFPQVNKVDVAGVLYVVDYFLITLAGLNSSTGRENSWEVVKVTGRTGDVLTVEREQQGTTAVIWPSGTKVALRITAGHADNFETAYNWGDHASVGYVNPLVAQGELKTDSFTLEIGKMYLLGTATNKTITMPVVNSTHNGQMFRLRDPYGTLESNPWTLSYATGGTAFGTSKLQGVAQNMVLDISRHKYDFIYINPSWYLI
jgi:hypothetical protein